MNFHFIILLPAILVYQIKISNTLPIQMNFFQDDKNNNLIKYITKAHYKLVGIRLHFTNETDIVTDEKKQEYDVESVKTMKYLISVGPDNKFEYQDKNILRDLGWKPAIPAYYSPPYPSMPRKEPLEPKDWLPGCPPGFHKDLRDEKIARAEWYKKVKKMKRLEQDLTSKELRKKRRREKDAGPTTLPPIKCVPTLERGYTHEMFVDFKHP